MQITYELKENDIKAFFDYSLKTNSVVKKLNVFNYLFIFAISYWQLLYAVLFADFLSFFNWTHFLVYLFTGTVTFGFVLALSKTIAYVTNRYVGTASAKKHTHGDGVLGEHLIKLKENYLVEVTDVNETQNSWKGVDRIEENDDYIFIYISPMNAHIIPKRCFSNQSDASMFYDEAKRLRDTAKTKFSPSYLASAN